MRRTVLNFAADLAVGLLFWGVIAHTAWAFCVAP